MPAFKLLRRSDYRRTRWKNDGGWTTEIAVDPPASGENAAGCFRWRVSIAEIERDGPFSAFSGIERDLLLLEGNGIELDIGDAEPVVLVQRFQRVRFAGEERVVCRLRAGPTRDFNVMTRRDDVRAEVMARPLVGSMVIFAEPGATWLVHVCAGHVEARSESARCGAEAGETLRCDFAAGGDGRVVLEGSGELVLVKFFPAGEAQSQRSSRV